MTVRMDLLLHFGREGESFSRTAQRLHLVKSTIHRLWNQHATLADHQRRNVALARQRAQRMVEWKEREAAKRARREEERARALQAANPQPQPAPEVEPMFCDDPRAALPDLGRLPARPATLVPRRWG